MNRLTGLVLVVAFMATMVASASYATVGYTFTTIKSTLIDSEGTFGGCGVLIGKMPDNVDCPNRWVVASCDGQFSSTQFAWRKYEEAKIAQVLGATVRVFIDDSRKVGNNCFLQRIDSLSIP